MKYQEYLSQRDEVEKLQKAMDESSRYVRSVKTYTVSKRGNPPKKPENYIEVSEDLIKKVASFELYKNRLNMYYNIVAKDLVQFVSKEDMDDVKVSSDDTYDNDYEYIYNHGVLIEKVLANLPADKRQEIDNKIEEAIESNNIEYSVIRYKQNDKPLIDQVKERFSDDKEFCDTLSAFEEKYYVKDNLNGALEKTYHAFTDTGENLTKFRTSEAIQANDGNRYAKANQALNDFGLKGGYITDTSIRFFNDYSLKKDRDVIIDSVKETFDFEVDSNRAQLMKDTVKALKESGVFEPGKFLMPEQPYKIYSLENYMDAKKNFTNNCLTASKEELTVLMDNLKKEEQKLDDLYSRVPSLSDEDGLYISGNISNSRNPEIPLKFREDIAKNAFINQTFIAMRMSEMLGLDINDVIDNPAILSEAVLNNDQIFFGYKDVTVAQNKGGVLSALMHYDPYSLKNASVVTAGPTIGRGIEGLSYIANDRSYVGSGSNVMGLTLNIKNFIHETYTEDIVTNKFDFMKKAILLNRDDVSVMEMSNAGEIHPLTGEVIKQPIKMSDLTPHDVVKNATEIYKEYIQNEIQDAKADRPLSERGTAINLEEIVKVTVELACKEYVELSKTMPTKSMPQEEINKRMASIKDYLKKDPREPFLEAAKSVTTVNIEKTNDSFKSLVAKNKEYLQITNPKKYFDFAKRQFEKEQKTVTMADYAKVAKTPQEKSVATNLVKEEMALMKGNKQFNDDLKKIMNASEKLSKSRADDLKAGKKDKANESFKKLTVLDKKVGELQDKQLDSLEKAYLEGKVPDSYFKARVEQIMSLNTKEIPSFQHRMDSSVEGLKAFINGTPNGKPAFQKRDGFPPFYKNVVTPSGKVHGNDAPKINAEKAKAVEVAKPAEAKQEAKAVNTAPPAMGK